MTKRNGCFNRPPLPALIPLRAVEPISISGYIVNSECVEMIPNVFSRECEYTKTALGQADKGCFYNGEPCKWRKND
jgi:hypothetical protein